MKVANPQYFRMTDAALEDFYAIMRHPELVDRDKVTDFVRYCQGELRKFGPHPLRFGREKFAGAELYRIDYKYLPEDQINPRDNLSGRVSINAFIVLKNRCVPTKKWVRSPYRGGVNISFAGYHQMDPDKIVHEDTYTVIAFRIIKRCEPPEDVRADLEQGLREYESKKNFRRLDSALHALIGGKDPLSEPVPQPRPSRPMEPAKPMHPWLAILFFVVVVTSFFWIPFLLLLLGR